VTVADAERRLHVDASGEDRQVASRISAKLDVTVSDDPRGSIVSSTGRYEITGRIATLGAAAIRKKGEHVLERFFVEMARSLA
jgi:carbon monoxide dehydrogenase subunit G